ncbi:cupin domain-containing protein [Gudongella sp. DL1XJH-153]|uniref:cupin domain-containing protein n=1 Tax=Gudongella sp. DL1XJH-153 TaxID=3409804 RepID=UPI003BB73A74
MLRIKDDMIVENIEGLKGGKGFVKVINFFNPEDFLGKGRLYGMSVIKPGHSIGYHKHTGDQEAYFVLKGEARYVDNGEEFTLKPGDLAICKDGDYHSIESIGGDDLEYIMLILYS